MAPPGAMCCGARALLAPALAALLGPAGAEPNASEIEHLDWMHVPKTGTTFKFALVLRECEHLEKVLASPEFDVDSSPKKTKRLDALRAITTRVKSYQAVKRNPRSCGVHPDSPPLHPSEEQGHQGWPVSSVVTLLRSPFSRAASGFVHNLHHSCGFPDRQVVLHNFSQYTVKPSTAGICKALLAGPSATDYERALGFVLRYGRCVEDCMTHMITGHDCGKYPFPELSEKQAASRLERALRKLDQFAFVGLTERWAQSLCLFSKLFPKPSGRPYPDFLLSKQRVSMDKTCEVVVEQVLRSGGGGYTESSDKVVYARAVELFERAIADHPECQA